MGALIQLPTLMLSVLAVSPELAFLMLSNPQKAAVFIFTEDMHCRFSSNTSASAAAAAAGEKMREKMAGSFAAMKNLNIGFSRQNKLS